MEPRNKDGVKQLISDMDRRAALATVRAEVVEVLTGAVYQLLIEGRVAPRQRSTKRPRVGNRG